MHKILIIGHRGAAGYEPENTIRAIIKGFECGADYVEVDVRQTKDGYLVLMHDEKVDRTTNGRGYLRELTLEEVRKLDAGKGEKVPLVEEVLEVVKKKGGGIVFEIKEVGIEEKLLSLIEKFKMIDRVIIASFHYEALEKVKEINDEVCLSLIFSKDPISNLKRAIKLGVDIVSAHYSLIDSNFIEKAYKLNLKVNAWTVNEKDLVVKLVKLGVNSITSDYPCLVKEVLEELGVR